MSVINVSAFSGLNQNPLVDVPTPDVPLLHGITGGMATYWGVAAPARTESLSVAYVDYDYNISPYSEPLVMDLAEAGGYAIRITDNVVNDPRIRGVVLNINGQIGVICEGGTSPYNMPWVKRPWVTLLRPDWQSDIRMSPWAAPHGGSSSKLTQAPPMPKVRRWNVPNVDLPISYTWIAETGETARGPSVISPAIPGLPPTAMTYRNFYCPGVQVPPGAKGYKVYAELNGQAVPLGQFEIDNMQPSVFAAARTIPKAQSVLSPLQLALNIANPEDTILVDDDVVTRVPILDRYGEGNSKRGVVVTAPHGGKWNLRVEGANFKFPALLVQNQFSEWRGVRIEGDASAGITFSDFSGGQAFGTRFKDFTISLDSSKETTGIRLEHYAASTYFGHSASELYFENGRVSAATATKFCGPQSANIILEQMHLFGAQDRRRGTSAIYLDTENPLSIGGGCFADWGYCLLYAGMRANGRLGGIWVDQGYECFLEAFSHYPARIEIDRGKLNCWSSPPLDLGGEVPWLARGGWDRIALSNLSIQQNHTGPGPFMLRSSCQPEITNCPQIEPIIHLQP